MRDGIARDAIRAATIAAHESSATLPAAKARRECPAETLVAS
jgi:hypothetical protein